MMYAITDPCWGLVKWATSWRQFRARSSGIVWEKYNERDFAENHGSLLYMLSVWKPILERCKTSMESFRTHVGHWHALRTCRPSGNYGTSRLVPYLQVRPSLLIRRSHRLFTLWALGLQMSFRHDDVIKWKHFPRHWLFVRGIHRWPVNSPHKGQWRGALMFSLICAWINAWVNNREAGDLRRYRAHCDVIVVETTWQGTRTMTPVMSTGKQRSTTKSEYNISYKICIRSVIGVLCFVLVKKQ